MHCIILPGHHPLGNVCVCYSFKGVNEIFLMQQSYLYFQAADQESQFISIIAENFLQRIAHAYFVATGPCYVIGNLIGVVLLGGRLTSLVPRPHVWE